MELLKNNIDKVRTKKLKALAVFEKVRNELSAAIQQCHDLIQASTDTIAKKEAEIKLERDTIASACNEIDSMSRIVEKISALY